MNAIKLLLVLALTVAAVLLWQKYPSQISFSYGNWLVEMPLWLVALAVLLLLFVQHICLNLVFAAKRAKWRVANWLQNKKVSTKQQQTKKAFFSLIAGNWHKAEQYALQAAKGKFSWINYLIATKAAKEQHAWQRSYQYLQSAEKNCQTMPLEFKLLRAQLCYQQEKYELCLQELQKLPKKYANNHKLLSTYAAVYQARREWQQLLRLLPQLKKYRVFSSARCQEIEINASKNLLATQNNKQQLQTAFRMLPRNMRYHNQPILAYVQALIKLKEYDFAEVVISNNLSRNWHKELVIQYGLIPGEDPKRTQQAEKWLKEHSQDPALLLTLGRLCLKQRIWGKAKQYLEQSLQLCADPACYAELGRLNGLLGESASSLDCYQKGLMQLTQVLDLATND